MDKVTIKTRNALKSALLGLMELSKDVLVYGINETSNEIFCKPVSIAKCKSRLLSCSRMEIKHLGHYVEVEKAIVGWLKQHIRCPCNCRTWWSLVSPSNWIKYNIDKELYILKLGIGNIYYYIVLRQEIVNQFRQKL